MFCSQHTPWTIFPPTLPCRLWNIYVLNSFAVPSTSHCTKNPVCAKLTGQKLLAWGAEHQLRESLAHGAHGRQVLVGPTGEHSAHPKGHCDVQLTSYFVALAIPLPRYSAPTLSAKKHPLELNHCMFAIASLLEIIIIIPIFFARGCLEVTSSPRSQLRVANYTCRQCLGRCTSGALHWSSTNHTC